MPTNFTERTSAPPPDFFRPLLAGWFQASRTPKCPDTPRLDGKLAVVTGGNAGIGIEISRGLAARGAELIIAARNPTTATAARETISKETGATVHHVPLDLADLRSVAGATKSIEEIAGGRRIDVLVANAGVAPTKHSLSAQGHELGFAVNVLGHYVFARRLANSGALDGGRLVVMTAELYPRATDCTADFRYGGRLGMYAAYCRSKLGTLWFAREFAERYQQTEVYPVHPGVIATGIVNDGKPMSNGLLDRILINAVAGAQTPLILATQPGLQRGGYYHNKLGLVRLPPTDIALDAQKSARLWSRLDELGAAFV